MQTEPLFVCNSLLNVKPFNAPTGFKYVIVHVNTHTQYLKSQVTKPCAHFHSVNLELRIAPEIIMPNVL